MPRGNATIQTMWCLHQRNVCPMPEGIRLHGLVLPSCKLEGAATNITEQELKRFYRYANLLALVSTLFTLAWVVCATLAITSTCKGLP